MMTVIIHCDRCGERIDRSRARLSLECGTTPPTWPTNSASGRPALDLCGPCLDGLAGWLRRTEPAL